MQAYVVCELQDKHNVLWAFLKAHLKVSSPIWLHRVALHPGTHTLVNSFERH